MKLNEILLFDEKTVTRRTEKINEKEAIKFIKEHCSEIVKRYKTSDVRLYRGFEYAGDYVFGDSISQTRKSKNTLNYYTLMMDNSELWKNFPKRSQSFICTTALGTASLYGSPYLVFPVDGTEIGVCPVPDIWFFKVKQIKYALSEFNDAIKDLATLYDIKLSETNFNKFKTDLISLGHAVEKNKNLIKMVGTKKWHDEMQWDKKFKGHGFANWFIPNFANMILQNTNDLYKWLDDFLKPEKFKITNTSNFNVTGKHECWFSGQAVFIDSKLVTKSFLKTLS